MSDKRESVSSPAGARVTATAKALRVLDCFTPTQPELSLAQISRILNMPKSTLLNQLRTDVRETEVADAEAFHNGAKYTRSDIIEELNRMSSALHIVMCRYLAGQYQQQ